MPRSCRVGQPYPSIPVGDRAEGMPLNLVVDCELVSETHVVELVEAKYRDAWRDRPVGRIGLGRILFAHRAETSA